MKKRIYNLLLCLGLVITVLSCGSKKSEKNVEINPAFIEAVHQYDELYPFHEGLAIVSKNGKKGYIDIKGDLAIPCQFFGAGDFSENLAPVWDENFMLSFIDRKGVKIINTNHKIDTRNYFGNQVPKLSTWFNFDTIQFNNGICKYIIQKGDGGEDYEIETIYINKNGEKVDEPKEVIINNNDNNEEYSIFKENLKYGLKDKNGNVIIPPNYSSLSFPSNGVALATLSEFRDYENRRAYLDAIADGEEVSRIIYGYISLDGLSTFTADDIMNLNEFKDLVEKEKIQREQAKIEEQRRQEELRRMGNDFVVTLSANFDEYHNMCDRFSNIGDGSRFRDSFVTKAWKVPNNKRLKYLYYKNLSRDISIGTIQIHVYDNNGKSNAQYDLRNCGEFNVLGGEFICVKVFGIGAWPGSDDCHFEINCYFKEFEE